MGTSALGIVGELLTSLEGSALRVQPASCSRSRHRQSSCSRCSRVCPTGAILWSPGLTVDRERCTGCGICASVCPTGALEAHSPANDELLVMGLRALQNRNWLSFACQPALDAGLAGNASIPVRCLGRLDESILVSLVARGAHTIWLVHADCATCPQAGGEQVAQAAVDCSVQLLSALSNNALIAMTSEMPSLQDLDFAGSGRELSRRGFFRAIMRETAQLGDLTIQSMHTSEVQDPRITKPGADLHTVLPLKRRLLLDAMRRLSTADHVPFDGGTDGLWIDLAFNENCTVCQMCAHFCPTGALTKISQDDQLGVVFRLALCTNCGLCRDVCYRQAVVSSTTVDLNQIFRSADELLCLRQADDAAWKQASQERLQRHLIETLNI